MGELKDRRARKKAQTRQQIRSIAHDLFAEHGFDAVTIADIANKADVAVQTVFNHFATKEELFFDGRADWVDAAAEAVRSRAEGVPPLSALREHLLESVRCYLHVLADPEVQGIVATLEASPALSSYERELHHRCVEQLSEALVEAHPGVTTGSSQAIDARISASLTAAIWMAAIRGLLIEHRTELCRGVNAAEMGAAVELLAGQVLAQFEVNLALLPGAQMPVAPVQQITGRPAGVRRAV